LAPATKATHDIALRLEKNRWKGVVEPRVLLRALCPTESGEIRALGEDEEFWDALRTHIANAPAEMEERRGGIVEDRRREGFAGVAGDLFSSGESVVVAVADVPRRRAGLEDVVAALSDGPMPAASWAVLAARPELVQGFDHLVALDPPPLGIGDPVLDVTTRAHLAWGPAEAEFAIAAYRASLDLRPQLTEVFLSLRQLPPDASGAEIETALRGTARYPRGAAACARLLTVLTELGLIELDVSAPRVSIIDGIRSDLELSPTYRAARDELAATERALAPELPRGAEPATLEPAATG
jgi:hypothetical protein